MEDLVIRGSGTSRYIKSNVASNITFQEFINKLRAGTLTIDLAGINVDGITQLGTPLNKANLLTDATAALVQAFALSTDPPSTPNEALAALTLRTAKIVTGSYVGTGTWGPSHPTSVSIDFEPKVFMIQYGAYLGILIYGNSSIWVQSGSNWWGLPTTYSSTAKTLSWYYYTTTEGDWSMMQFNMQGYTFNWIAIG